MALSTISYTVIAPPKVKITKSTVSKDGAKFTFAGHGSKVKSFQCALQRKGSGKHGPSFAKCKSPKSYGKLKPGSYTFSVRAVGPGGKSAAAKHHFTIS